MVNLKALAIFGFILLVVVITLTFLVVNERVFIYKSVSLNGDKVMLSIEAKKQLDAIYTDDLQVEVPACLSGMVTDDGIKIDGVTRAEIVESTPQNATYIRCPTYIKESKIISTIHNHVFPNDVCKLSDTDLVTYAGDLDRGQILIGLKCRLGYIFFVLTRMSYELEEW